MLTLQDQASVATGAETAEADPTAERQQRDELEAEVETERAINRGLQVQVTKLQAQVRMHENQASEAAEAAVTSAEAQELAKTKRRNEELTAQVTILVGRIKELQGMPGRTDGAAQGAAEVEAALAEKNQELEKLKEALTEKSKMIERLKTALNAL